MPMGSPGCPEFAFWTASMDSVRMVSMLSCSMRTSVAASMTPYATRDRHDEPTRLPLREPVPRGRRRPPRVPRRRRPGGAARVVDARRADVVVPLAPRNAARARRGLPLHRARPRGLRALRQARADRVVHLRPPRRAHGGAARAPRPARPHDGRARLGRADRAAARRRAPGPDLAPG